MTLSGETDSGWRIGYRPDHGAELLDLSLASLADLTRAIEREWQRRLASADPAVAMADTYEVRDERLEGALRELADYIDGKLPSGFGFCLLLFTFEPGVTFYISNAERGTMIAALQEFIRSNKERGH